LYHLFHLQSDDLVHRECEFNGDESHIWVLVLKAGCNKFVEHEVPVPGLRVDPVLLDKQLHEFKACEHYPPLLLVGVGPTPVHVVHDPVDQLLDVHSWVPEQPDKRVQRVVARTKV
jgi:hypothetical protein